MSSLDSFLGSRLSPDGKRFEVERSSRSVTTTSSLFSSGLTCSTSENLLQAKIEYLEKDRMELSEKLLKRDERDRSLKLKIELLETQLKTLEQSKSEAQEHMENTSRELMSLQLQRDELEQEVKRLRASSAAAMESGIWSKMTAATRELRRIEEDLNNSNIEKELLLHEKEELLKNIESLNQKLQASEVSIRILNKTTEEARLKTQSLEVKMRELEAAKKKNDDIEATYMTAKQEYESSCANYELMMEEMNARISDLEQKLEESLAPKVVPAIDIDSEEIDGNAAIIIAELRKKLAESENQRRSLHNKLQDLRGNIRVYVRCRPFLKSDNEDSTTSEDSCIRCNMDGNSITIAGSGRGSGQNFVFDQVFKPETTQDEVYKNVSDLVQSALDGYSVCIFSYGQTGSGKTHTMNGERRGNMRGIIPRAVEQILRHSCVMQEEGWNVELSATIIEIYNEELKDLLAPTKAEINSNKLKVFQINGKTQVQGANSVKIGTENVHKGLDQLEKLLDQATKARKTASTDMNETSSRSHVIFMLDINCIHANGNTVLTGGLRLCDLAGSERLDRTGTANDAARLKETVNINKSLSCLADVFIALGNKSSHIPFRNSKLTMLLQDCLSGDGKALMFVNVSPTMASSHETLCSLRFATQANQIEMGKAQRHIYSLPQPTSAAPSNSLTVKTSTSALSAKPSVSPRAATTTAVSEVIVAETSNNETSIVAATTFSVNRIPFSAAAATGPTQPVEQPKPKANDSTNSENNAASSNQARVSFQLPDKMSTSQDDSFGDFLGDLDGNTRPKTQPSSVLKSKAAKRKSLSSGPQNLISSSTSFLSQPVASGATRLSLAPSTTFINQNTLPSCSEPCNAPKRSRLSINPSSKSSWR